ncbi:unnamed protein product [Hermetia illucens]|uniref:Peptidoglycan-recognition protein n=1 Tax=Hermetia illucens TaxID=343691 RepID=A0A7R8V406_HERIL|nr:unnamed protein product [Hermetia illucens]
MYKTIGIIAVVCVFLPESMTIVTREEWGAKPPKTPTLFNGPSPYVIIHHSYEPGACYTAKECQEAVQSIQELHQEVRGWSDVGYTFLIGGDGNVYEGRGFNVVGAHAPGYNDKSVGICLIGDWRTELPTEKMLEATHKLIEYGISSGYIVKDYKLLVPIFVLLLIALLPNIMMAYVTREEWGAKPAKLVEKFRGPSPYVIIHHSYQPGACFTTDDCKAAMRSMQEFHQIGRGWNDIGYTFAIGGDGNIYEGRGFNVVGAHAPGYNNRSVGICVIGDWRFKLPPPNMLEAVHNLIDYGVSKEFIAKDFKLLGHRQVRDTECPGDRLFDEITTWPHWSAFPSQSNKKINV